MDNKINNNNFTFNFFRDVIKSRFNDFINFNKNIINKVLYFTLFNDYLFKKYKKYRKINI